MKFKSRTAHILYILNSAYMWTCIPMLSGREILYVAQNMCKLLYLDSFDRVI